jgi:hypothetical protein
LFGFLAFSLLLMDALDLIASALVAHLHLLKSGAGLFRRTWPVLFLRFALHDFLREVGVDEYPWALIMAGWRQTARENLDVG